MSAPSPVGTVGSVGDVPLARRPRASVIVTSFEAPDLLRRCLTALAADPFQDLEILVVDASATDPSAWVAHEFPRVRVVRSIERSTPALRWSGVRLASGWIVAATESRMEPAPGWCATFVRAHEEWPDAVAIGGSVGLGQDPSAWDVAMYLCEHGPFAPPVPSAPASLVSSANVSYKRATLVEARDILDAGRWDAVLHERWRREGRGLRTCPAAVVSMSGLGPAECLRLRFHYGRAYAADRMAGQPTGRRLVYAAGSLVLPLLLTWRLAGVAGRKGLSTWFRRSFGWIALFNLAWGWGEGAGYLLGRARSSRIY